MKNVEFLEEDEYVNLYNAINLGSVTYIFPSTNQTNLHKKTSIFQVNLV